MFCGPSFTILGCLKTIGWLPPVAWIHNLRHTKMQINCLLTSYIQNTRCKWPRCCVYVFEISHPIDIHSWEYDRLFVCLPSLLESCGFEFRLMIYLERHWCIGLRITRAVGITIHFWYFLMRGRECFAAPRYFAEAHPLYCVQDGDVVWCHDYHLMCLPKYLKELDSRMKVGWFLHTPFPSSEIYRTLPLRSELLKAVLAADLIGYVSSLLIFEFPTLFFLRREALRCRTCSPILQQDACTFL